MPAVRPPEGYREMLTLELAEEYGPVYPQGGTWEDTARLLYAEEPEHMASLTAALESQGWREPIRLSEPEELFENESPLVLDGTHRVVIALREGVISVPVVTRSEMVFGRDPGWAVELTVRLREGEDLGEDGEEELFALLRSFALTDAVWLTASSLSSRGGVWKLSYALEDRLLLSALKRTAGKRLRSTFPGRSFALSLATDG